MPLITCHTPQGGAGTTFVAAQLAMTLAELGAEVTVLTLATFDPLPLHFGLAPGEPLPPLDAPPDRKVVVAGIDLRSAAGAGDDPDLVPRLREAGFLAPHGERVLIVDLPSGERALAARLAPLARVQICPLTGTPEGLALLPALFGEMSDARLETMLFVISLLDETRRFARHAAAFIGELAGERLAGTIRRDEAVSEALAMLLPLYRHAPASIALADAGAMARIVARTLDRGVIGASAPLAQCPS